MLWENIDVMYFGSPGVFCVFSRTIIRSENILLTSGAALRPLQPCDRRGGLCGTATSQRTTGASLYIHCMTCLLVRCVRRMSAWLSIVFYCHRSKMMEWVKDSTACPSINLAASSSVVWSRNANCKLFCSILRQCRL